MRPGERTVLKVTQTGSVRTGLECSHPNSTFSEAPGSHSPAQRVDGDSHAQRAGGRAWENQGLLSTCKTTLY